MNESSLLLWLVILGSIPAGGWSLRQPLKKPNIIVFFADDMGYGDLLSYGHPTQEYGAIDQMAAEGIRFTQWYSTSSVCTPSRAALLTGRLPVRSGFYATNGPTHERVFLTSGGGGLPRDEVTLPEALKNVGYSTGMVGKWHLGINAYRHDDGYHLPTHHGFDFVGTVLPFTNHWACDSHKIHLPHANRKLCFLYYNTTITQQPINHDNLTATLVLDAKSFIYDNQENPFFLYFSFAHMHANLFTARRFKGSSKRGRYGDDMNEMSWAVGEILDTIRSTGLSHNTLAFFISDNGPHVEICEEGGSPGMLKGGKATSWEGGIRVPAIAWWPGVIAGGQVSSQVVSTIDVFASAVDFAGGTLPHDRIIDSLSLKSLLLHKAQSPHQVLFFYCSDRLMALRYNSYKIHFHSHSFPSEEFIRYYACPDGGLPVTQFYYCYDCYGNCITSHNPPLIYNVEKDPGEKHPLSPWQHKEMIESVMAVVAEHKSTLKTSSHDPQLNIIHRSLVPCCNPPYCVCN
ncbi:arylsulfatase-like [Saccoglossus kowalevskii]